MMSIIERIGQRTFKRNVAQTLYAGELGLGEVGTLLESRRANAIYALGNDD